jgi:hypothetical protein
MLSSFEINILPSILGVIVYTAISLIWYSPMFLGKAWMRLKGLNQQDLQSANQMIALSVISAVIVVFVLNLIITWSDVLTVGGGLLIAILTSLFVSTVSFNSVCFDKKEGFGNRSWLWLIEFGNTFTTFAIISILFALWK